MKGLSGPVKGRQKASQRPPKSVEKPSKLLMFFEGVSETFKKSSQRHFKMSFTGFLKAFKWPKICPVECLKRSEGLFFQSLYQLHKLITFIFTGQSINFGNYSILTRNDVEKLHTKASLWSSYSGSVKKNIKPLQEINSIRGLRYFGPSQMSLFRLIIHSLSIIAVFKYNVFLRSTLMIIALAYLNSYLGSLVILSQILIVIFNLIIFIVSLREKEKDLLNSHKNLDNIKKIAH